MGLPRPESTGQGIGITAMTEAGQSPVPRKNRNRALQRSTSSRISAARSGLRALHRGAVNVLGTPDGRWALVSTSLTASVAVIVTAMALNASPTSSPRAYRPQAGQASLPYNLLLRLAGLGVLPSAQPSNPYRNASLFPGTGLAGPLDALIHRHDDFGKPPLETRTLTVESGDTMMAMLQDAGVASEDAAKVVEAMRPLYSPRAIKSGQTFEARFGAAQYADANQNSATADDADSSPVKRLLSLSFAPALDHEITVTLTGPDSYLAQDVQKKLASHYEHVGGTIDSSLYLSAVQAGLPASVVVEIIRMFSFEVDFQRDVHEGDSFEVFFNHYFTPEGRPAKPGDILAASLTLDGKRHLLYRFDTPDGPEYFDSNGQSAKSLLMKTPVDGARISSGFGRRFHPILGYTRMHKGIDFAVPTGTPVMAAGTGTIAFEGRASGYGNFMLIKHADGYSTAYGHLSRFAKGTHVGGHVVQGEVVAYSGMTGLATGPHLHYEVRIDNKQVNPAAIKVASGRQLEGGELEAFQAERARIDTLLASLPLQHKVAQAAGLRETAVR
jgi:murein DD-endopeptidase MepM/ murein hydrolase activator NlpD